MDKRLTGIAIASAAAALFVTAMAPVTAADSVKVKCYGANACKGKAECKTSMSDCKGHNACKGKGFVMMDEQTCLNTVGRK